MTWYPRKLSVMLCVTVVLTATGCSVFDASLLPDVDCRGRRPPIPPQVEDGDDGKEYVVVLRDIFIDQRAAPGMDEADAPWRDIGFNFDGFCTTSDNLATECVPMSDGASVQVDGNDGIDNAFGNEFFPLVSLAQPGIDQDLRDSQERGVGAVLLRITGWNGERDDPRVTIAIAQTVFGTPKVGGLCPEVGTDVVIVGTELFLSDGVTPAPLPAWDGEDCFWVREDNFIGGELSLPEVNITTAHVTDGTIAGFVPAGTSIRLFGTNVGVNVKMSELIAEGDIYDALALGMTDPPPVVTVAGRWGFNDLLATAENVGICPGTSTFNITMRSLAGTVDVQLDPGNPVDTTAPCDALSVGTTFNAYVGSIGGVTVGQVLPNSCDEPAP